MKTWHHPQTGSTWHIALPSKEDRATATGKDHRKFGEIRTHGFWNEEGQTDQQTDIKTRWSPLPGRSIVISALTLLIGWQEGHRIFKNLLHNNYKRCSFGIYPARYGVNLTLENLPEVKRKPKLVAMVFIYTGIYLNITMNTIAIDF